MTAGVITLRESLAANRDIYRAALSCDAFACEADRVVALRALATERAELENALAVLGGARVKVSVQP